MRLQIIEKGIQFIKKCGKTIAAAAICLTATMLLLSGCSDRPDPAENSRLLSGEHEVRTASATPTGEEMLTPAGTPTITPTEAPGKETTPTPAATATPTITPAATVTPAATPTPAATATPSATPTPTPEGGQSGESNRTGKLVVIDAGHQRKGNNDKEPDGPNSATLKAKVSSGTTGHFTGIPEYELNLIVAKKLQSILLERGYRVIMVRETHDVNLSNSERAEIANKAGADVFVRIHANANDNSDVNGAETLCQTKNNPYNSALYPQSRKLSQSILDALCAECGCKKRHVVETDTMSGINWCKVPVTIVEMGFMTNEKEDRLMATEEYRDKLAKGIADGIDAYFAE